MKKFVTIKDGIYIFIIIILCFLIFLFNLDFKINIFDKNNWIDIIIGCLSITISGILSLLLIKQGYKLNEKSEKIETNIFNKQIDLDLRERRLDVYGTIMSLGVSSIINNENYIITNYITGNHSKNEKRFNEIIDKEKDLVIALCESELIFKGNEELLKYIRNIFDTFVDYKGEIQNFFNQLKNLKKVTICELKNDGICILTDEIPLNIIEINPNEYLKCKNIFSEQYKSVRTKEKDLIKLITDKRLIDLFDQAININKIGGVK